MVLSQLDRLTYAASQVLMAEGITQRLDQLLAENNEIRDENTAMANALQRIARVSA